MDRALLFIFLFSNGVHSSLVRPARPSFQTLELTDSEPVSPEEVDIDTDINIDQLVASLPNHHKLPFYETTPEISESSFVSEERRNEHRAKSYMLATLAGIKGSEIGQDQIELEFQKIDNEPKIKNESSDEKLLVCYYSVPTMYDQPYPVYPEQIDPFLCTHLIIGFGRVYNYSLVPNDSNDREFYKRTVGLKKANPNLKIMLSIGSMNSRNGSGQGLDFEGMMASNLTRGRFIRNAVQFLSEYGFDGLDVDWEFPGKEGPASQKDQLTDFLAEFRSYTTQPVDSESSKFILTAAVPATKYIVDIGFDIPGIARSVDFVNLMTYDFHYFSTWSPVTGPNSPLFNVSMEMGFLRTLNTAWAAKYWFLGGMPAQKLIVGLPTYGRTFRLVDERYHGYYDFASGIGSVGSGGFISHVQICDFMAANGTTVVFDKGSREPYAYNGRDWISFDNEESAKEKAQFVKDMKFGGVMVYSINADDAWKSCPSSASKFPIIQSAKKTLMLMS